MTDPTPTLQTLSPSPAKTVSHVLGEITWLMSQSPVHRQLFISDLEWFCMPAILLEQFRIYNGPNSPAAVALWARVSPETEQRLLTGGNRLRTDEWQGGDLYWLIELVAPFGGQAEILEDLKASVFAGKTFKFHHMTPDGRREVSVVDATASTLN